MITLLRNLTAMNPPQFGYEKLPTSIEITPAADLCRIKYYRNYFAHLDKGKIDTAFFQISWTDMTGVCMFYLLKKMIALKTFTANFVSTDDVCLLFAKVLIHHTNE